MTHRPVATVAELAELDTDEIVEGYRDGRADAPEPGDNRSRAYYHGWRCGAMDAGRLEIDATHRGLISEVMRTKYLTR